MEIWVLKVKESTPESIVDCVIDQIKKGGSIVVPAGSMEVKLIEADK